MTWPDRRSRDLDNLIDPTAIAKRLLDDAEKAIRDWNTPPSLASCSRCLDTHPPLSNCRAHPSRASLCRQLAECFYAPDSTKRRGDAFQLLLGLFRSAALMYRPVFAYEKCMICGRLQHQKQCTEATDYLALSMRRDEIRRMTITPAIQTEFLAMIDAMMDRAIVHESGRVFLAQTPTAKRLHLSLAQQRKRQRHRSPSPESNQIKGEPDPLWEHTRQLLSPRSDRRCLFCRKESHAHERPCPEFVDPAVVERRRIEIGRWKGNGSEGKIGWLGVLDDLLARLGVSLGGMSSTSQPSGSSGGNGSVGGNGGGSGTGRHRSTPAAPQQQQQPNQPQSQVIIKKMGCLICTKQTHLGKPCPDRFDPALLDQRKKYIESANMEEQHRTKCLQYIGTLLGRLRAPFEVFGLEKLKETREGGSEWAALAAVPADEGLDEGINEGDAAKAKQVPRIFKYEFSDSFQKPYLKACYRVVFDPFEKPDEKLRRWRTFCVTGDRVIMIAYVDDDGKIRPLQEYEDADEGEELYTCAWSRDPVTSSPVLVAAGKRGVLKVFHTRRRALIRSIPGHGFDVYGLTAHPHHPHIIFSASRDQSIRMWDLHTGQVLAVFSGDGGHKDAVLSVDVQEKGWAVVSGGMDHSIKVWDLKPLEDIINASVERVEAARTAASSSVSLSSSSSDPRVYQAVEKYVSPRGVHYPYFSTTGVHSNKVDCVRFYGEYILSRSAAEGRVLFWEADGGLPGCGGECESRVDEYGERWYRPTATKFTIWAEFRHPYLESWYYSFHSSTVTHTLVVPHTDDQVRIWDLLDLTYRPYYGTHGRGFRLGTGNDCDLTDDNKHGGIKKAACLQAPGGGGGQPDQSNPRGRPKKKEREWLDLRCVTESLDGRVVVAVGSSGWVGVWKRVKIDDEDDSSETDKGKSRKRSSEDDDIDVKEESGEDEESEEEVVEEVMVGRGGRVLKRVVRGSIDSGEEDEIGVTIGKSRRVLRSASAASGENIIVEEVEEEVAVGVVGRVLRTKKTE